MRFDRAIRCIGNALPLNSDAAGLALKTPPCFQNPEARSQKPEAQTVRRQLLSFGMHFLTRFSFPYIAFQFPALTCLILPFPQVPSSTKTDAPCCMTCTGSCLR